MNELNEKDLELVVSQEELGYLETNAKNIKEKVLAILPNYSAENYDESNIDIAKADKALLNKSAKALNDKRIELEKKFNAPFEEFKTIIKETTDLIKQASSKIDEVVKDVDNKEKNKRKEIIVKNYEEKINELKDILPLEKIFEDKWLNKGSFNDKGEFKLVNELQDKINRVRNDLIAIGELHSKYEVELKNDYLNNFDLSRVIAKNTELIKKEELLKIQQEESQKVIIEQKEERILEDAGKKVMTYITDDELTYTLKITGKRSQLVALKKFLETNEMKYEKVA
jgi:hypothetical protein